jgi:hypothetical protein
MDTATFIRARDSWTSSTQTAGTRTFPPISNRIAAFGRSTAVGRLSLDPIGLDVGIGIGFSTAPAGWT